MAESAIEWTGVTLNPTTGCDRVSPGCDNCYALTLAARLKAMGQGKYQRDGDPRTSGPGFGLTIHEDVLSIPYRWRKPQTVFVNSMSDLFHAQVPTEFILRLFKTMRDTPQHTYQILTKRAERMERLMRSLAWYAVTEEDRAAGFRGYMPYLMDPLKNESMPMGLPKPLPKVWLGVSVETPTYYSRIRHLQRTPAAVRFLSCEPLLAPLPDLPLDGIHWVIVGGESGPGARPMHPDWVRDIRDQCQRAGVAFFFKQWGAWTPDRPAGYHRVSGAPDRVGRYSHELVVMEASGAMYDQDDPDSWTRCTRLWRVGKKRAGRVLDGRTWDEMPGRPR
jgi:protein gp37